MKPRIFILCALAVAASIPPSIVVAAPASTSSVIVRLAHGAIDLPEGAAAPIGSVPIQAPGLRARLATAGAEQIRRMFPNARPGERFSKNMLGETIQIDDLSEFYIVRVIPGTAAEAARRLRGAPGVIEAHQPVLRELDAIPTDSMFGQEWWARDTAQACADSSIADVDINGPEAWDITTGISSVKIGIIDTGISLLHADLRPRAQFAATFAPDVDCHCVAQMNCPENDCFQPAGSSTIDVVGHGTAVAGMAAAAGNNGPGVAGVAWGVTPVAFKIFNSAGGPLSCWSAEAIDSARALGIPILNMSYHGGYDLAELTAARNAFYNGQLLVAAIGNGGDTITNFPAGYKNTVCAVGAVYANGKRWIWSSYGQHIDLCAPGGRHIATTKWTVGTNCNGSNGWWDCASGLTGTSMAAPIVGGVGALLLSKYPSFNLVGEDLQHIMSVTAHDVTGPGYQTGWDLQTGYGYVRADAALNFLASPKQLVHLQVGSLGQIRIDTTNVQFIGVPGITNGTYITRRYLMRKSVAFSPGFYAVPDTLVRSSGSIGAKPLSVYDYNLEVQWGTISSNSLTPAGCSVETYVYDVVTPNFQHIAWFPAPPESAKVALSLIGTPDTTPPGPVSDLSPDAVSSHQVIMIWTAPGGDGQTGQASSYDLRYAPWAINETNFYNAPSAPTDPPHAAGYGEQATISGLSSCTRYYFAIKSTDQAGNVSAISNLPNVKTACFPFGSDEVDAAPAAVELALAGSNPVQGSAVLRFGVPSRRAGERLELAVFDVSGRKIQVLESGPATAGRRTLEWNLRNESGGLVAGGVYFVRLRLPGVSIARRVVVMNAGR